MKLAIVGATGLVGSALVKAAEDAGHQVVALSKETGTDVLQPDGLAGQFASAEAVVDVTQSPSLEEAEAGAFFSRSAANIGQAARDAGVTRTVVLSIIGVDRIAEADAEAGTGYDGYYRAKRVQELATLAHAPGATVVRSSQFHDLARQAIGWGRDGDKTVVPDLVVQPIAVDAMVQVLLRGATGELPGPMIEVAGPRVEHLATLSTSYAAHVGDDVQVVADSVGDMVRNGVLLPGPDAHLVDPSFGEWLATQPTQAGRS